MHFFCEKDDEWQSMVDSEEDLPWADVDLMVAEECGSEQWFECEDRLEDGGGIFSTANWAESAHSDDCFCELREVWWTRIEEWNLVERLKAGFKKGEPGLLSSDELLTVRQDAITFLARHGFYVTGCVAEGQPFALEIMHGLLSLCKDKDQVLPHILKRGITTGVWEEIPPSGVFEAENRQAPEWTDIRSCERNWPSAEKEEQKVAELLEQEVQQGWVERWQGTWEDAEARWGERAVCGKLAIIQMEGKEDRLVGDSSACGASPNARSPERVRHPRARDIVQGLATCHALESRDGEPWSAIVMDVSAAHKRLKMAEEDAGMAFFFAVWASCTGMWWRILGQLGLPGGGPERRQP